MPEVVIYGLSPLIVVDDVATFVELEHCLEFTVNDYVHGLFLCGCKLAVQYCRRRCAVRRCSNRSIAIRNHVHLSEARIPNDQIDLCDVVGW